MLARYGKDVRQSIHDAIEEVDRVADTAQNSATASAAAAAESAASIAGVEERVKKMREQYGGKRSSGGRVMRQMRWQAKYLLLRASGTSQRWRRTRQRANRRRQNPRQRHQQASRRRR